MSNIVQEDFILTSKYFVYNLSLFYKAVYSQQTITTHNFGTHVQVFAFGV